MRKSHPAATGVPPITTYTPVEYVLPEGTYTSGVQRARPLEPCDCHGCGSLSTDDQPAHLVDEVCLDCPRCGSLPALSYTRPLSADVRDILQEEAARGHGRPSSSGGRTRKKNGRLVVRWEQEVALHLNGHSGERAHVTRLETASERFELQLTLDCKERLREVCHERRNDHGVAYPQAQCVRDALKEEVQRLGPLEPIERGTPRATLQMRLYPSELVLIDAAADYLGVSRHQVIEACLWQHLGE